MAKRLEDNGKQDLIDELGITPRRLNQLIQMGVIDAGGDEVFDLAINTRRYHAYKDGDREYVFAELTAAAHAFDDGMRRLQAEPDMKKRRALAERDGIGAHIGRLDAAYRLGNSMQEEHRQPLLARYCNQEVGKAASAFFAAIGVVVSDDAPNRRERRRAARG